MTLRETFGANVRNHRLARNLKQHHIAEAIGKTPGMVGQMERGETAPSFDTIEKIAAALDVPEVVLFATTPMSVPTGERGKLLQRVHVQLAKLSNAELARAVNAQGAGGIGQRAECVCSLSPLAGRGEVVAAQPRRKKSYARPPKPPLSSVHPARRGASS